MNNRWMKMSVLALSMSAITGTIYAQDQVAQTEVQNTNVVSETNTASEVTPGTDSVEDGSVTPSTEVVTSAPVPVSYTHLTLPTKA